MNIFLPISLNICSGWSKEPFHGGGSFDFPQHMLSIYYYTLLSRGLIWYLSHWRPLNAQTSLCNCKSHQSIHCSSKTDWLTDRSCALRHHYLLPLGEESNVWQIRQCHNHHWRSSHYADTHVHNKIETFNLIQGRSPYMVKVMFHTIRNCS